MPINEYDDILSKGKVASSGNEYLDLVGSQKDIQKQQLQTSFYKAKDKLPDRSADIQKLSKRSNLPEDFVERNYDELKKQSESKTDYSSLINNSPATATYMSNPYNAATSKDDVEPLSKMEKSVRLMRNRNPIARTGSEVKQSAMTGWNDLNASTWHLAMAYGLADIDTASIQIAESNKRSQELRSRVPDYAKDFNDVMSKQGQDVDRAFSLFSEGYDAQKNGKIGQALKDYSSGTIKTVGEVLDMVGSAVVRPRGLAYSTIQNLAHSLPSLITGFSGAKAGGFAGAKIGAGVALIAGQAGPQAAAPEELVTVPTFSAVGGSLGGIGGFVSGSFAGQVPVEVGAWINEQLSGKGYDLTDPEQIKQAYSDTEFIADIKAEAERKGITTAAVDSIFNMFAGKLIAGAKGTRLSRTLRTAGDIGVQSVGEGTSEFAGQVAAKKGLEGTSLGEAVQEGITSLGHSFGETAIGASTRGVDIKGKGKEVAQETIKKARDLFSKNPIKAAQEVSKEAGNAVKAQQDAQALSDIAEAVKESKTAQRNPDAIKEIIDIATQGDDDSNVYFQTQDWDDYWISKGESPSKKAAEIMGDGGKSYFEAKNNGDNFSLPLSDYVSKLASTDDFNGLLPSARTGLEGMSLQEAKDFLEGLPEVMDSLAEEAVNQDKEVQDIGEQVATNITNQLVNAGFEQTTAETYGQLYKSTFSTLAQRTGKSVDELFGRFNLKIQRQDQFADVSKKVSNSTGLEETDIQTEQKTAKPEVETANTILDENNKDTVEPKKGEKVAKIEDFGEVLHGARKFLDSFKTSLESEIDVENVTLTKAFPLPNYERLIENGLSNKDAISIAIIRQSIPNKPKYRKAAWAEKVKSARALSSEILAGNEKAKQQIALIMPVNKVNIIPLADKVKPEQIRALSEYEITPGYQYDKTAEDGKKRVFIVRAKGSREYFDTVSDAQDFVLNELKQSEVKAPTKKQIKFEIYQDRRTKEIYVGKKIASGKILKLHTTQTVSEARLYIKENQESLEEQLKNKKQAPSERKDANTARIGQDYRKGKDVTPEDFQKTFGFRGVQFGNWVENSRRQQDLNNAYDSFIDLANILDIPIKAVSLDGELGLAFGARGKGGKQAAKAHFESDNFVINLTKNEGAGSLAHEWWHSLDNYFGKKQRGTIDSFITKSPRAIESNVRDEVIQEIIKLKQYIQQSEYYKRSARLDKRRAKDYWSTTIELTARAFEKYVIDKASEFKNKNDFLANIEDETVWDTFEGMLGNEEKTYPYPSDKEALELKSIYDGLFNVLESRETEKGIELYQTEPQILFKKAQGLGDKLRNMFQKGTRVKGSFQFGNEKFNINLFKSADLSTFLHESGHFYLEMMGDLVDSDLSNDDQIKSDYESILKWLGVESRDQIKTEHHEKFARGFEAYLMEGKAPSSALRAAFAKFRAWLTSIYRSIRNLNAPINKEIRGVFDRLLATDEEISAAQEEAYITQIFTSAEQAGMTDEEFKLYEDTVREASQMAQDSLQQKILKQYRREQDKWWKDRTEEVRQQVTEEVNNDKNYIALSVLQKGTLPDGSPLPEGMEAIKISKKALTDTYDKSILKNLPKPYIYTQSDDGVHQDVAAEMLGYSSGDELINTLSGLPNKKQAIDTMTDARMREQYGDKLIDGSLAEDARLAVSNDERAKVILAELKALRKKQRESKNIATYEKNKEKREREYEIRWFEAEKKLAIALERGAKQSEIDKLKQASKEADELRRQKVKGVKDAIPTIDIVRRIAKNTIAGKKVRNIKPYNYFVAARKSSKQALEALSKNNYDEAAKFKQQELLSMELYREASRVQDEVDKTVNFMKRFSKKSTREKIAKSGSDYLDQIDSLLDRFDFAKGISLKSIDRRKSLLEWVQSQEELGLVADIPEKLLNESYKMNYKDLTIDELSGLKDSVKNIEHFARMKNRLLKAAKQRAFDEVIDEAVASVEANSKGKQKVDIETRLPKEETKRRVEGYFAEHRKFSSLVYQMDGFEDGGTLWEILTRPMNEAGDREVVMKEHATEKLKEIFSAYTTKELTQLYKKEFVPEINDSLTKMARLSVALNWGNADSKQKVMDGRNWSQDQVEAILDMLDQRDWNFVQNVWDFVDSYWAESKALAERVNGVAPGKVEAEPVQTKYGQFRGGYYPLKYDDILSDRAYENAAKESAEKAMRGAFIRATTKHGHRKQRVEGVKMPIRLDFGVLFEHVTEIIHDQTHYEFLIDTNKILKDERMKTAIKENYGDIVYRELTKTVNDVAAGIVPAQNSFEKAINWLRSGTSISAMGWNLMTSLQQPLGLTQSMVRIGPKWVAKGISRWLGSPQKMQTTINDIYYKSDMMRLRGKTQMREINEIRNKLRIRGKLSAIEDSYFYLIAKGQMIADIPTWLGAYEKAWGTDTEMTEEKAARLADQAVLDSQGGGQVKDLADIQRGGPLKKLWTNFYSYFNTTYNLTAESFKKHDIKSASGIGALAVDLLMLYTLPAVLGVLLKDAIKGGDDEPLPEKLIREQAGYVLGTMVGVRELGSVVQGFYGYEGPAGTRFFGEFGGLIKQIEQGEADAAFWKSLNQTGGILFHYPAGQIDRTFRGLNQMGRNKTSNPLVLVTGPKRQ